MWLKTKEGLSIQTTQIVFLKGYKFSTHKGYVYEVWARLADRRIILLKSFKNEEDTKKFLKYISKKIGG